jgi:lysozyme
MGIAPEALALIKQFEGYLRHIGNGHVAPYRCPANVPTIGWGSTFYENRLPVRMSDAPINRERATELLDFELQRVCVPAIAAKCKAPLHPLMHGALVSFTFNVGTGALASSTLLKRINAGRLDEVPKEFRKWTRGGGRVLAGLERRRVAEAAMFMAGVAALKRGHNGGPPIADPRPAPVQAPAPVATPSRPQATPGQWREFVSAVLRKVLFR